MCHEKHCYQRVGNNTVYSDADPKVNLVPKGSTVSFEEWIQMGYDKGSSLVRTLPSDAEIVAWGKGLLQATSALDILI